MNHYIYAQISTYKAYEDIHHHLVAILENKFGKVESGLQGDSWIEIRDSDERITLDTLGAMTHEIKAPTNDSKLVRIVIDYLREFYTIDEYNEPEEM